ncbi:hypothetical protein TNCT_73961 [Trichonephila clavata]|uniref:Uncharacterized protein n=1 Tax=Trichonephila clavata TaxID=2740835 RepID=A0A8X6F2B1_TRICU|nr:hypothetical protein TNCT_73961 [Trichonephila clavata]
MLQLIGIPSQSYSQCSPNISVRLSCLLRNLSRALHFLCAATADMDYTVCSTVVATAAAVEGRLLLSRDANEPVAQNFFSILFNAENVIGPLLSRIPLI